MKIFQELALYKRVITAPTSKIKTENSSLMMKMVRIRLDS